MTNLIGKKVVGFDGYTKTYGKIVGEQNPQYGFKCWVILWEDGTTDTHTKHTLKHKNEHVGIGVYWIEGDKATPTPKPVIPVYIENNSSIIQ